MTNKPLLLLGVVTALALVGSRASAGVCPPDAPLIPTAVSFISTVAPCTLGDLTFNGFGIDGEPPGATVQFGRVGPLFSVTLSSREEGAFFRTDSHFNFTVTATAPATISRGTGEYNVPRGPVRADLAMNGRFPPGLFPDGGTVEITFTPSVSSVSVQNHTVLLSGNSELRSITNTFTQTGGAAVPEPMSLSLFGLGLAGLALARRRR